MYNSNAGGWFAKHIERCKIIQEVEQVKNSLPNCYIFIEKFQTQEERELQQKEQFIQENKYLLDPTDDEEDYVEDEIMEEVLLSPSKSLSQEDMELKNLLPNQLQKKILCAEWIDPSFVNWR